MEELSQLQSNSANKNLGNNNCISPLNVIALVCRQKKKKIKTTTGNVKKRKR